MSLGLVIYDPRRIKEAKTLLEKYGLFDKTRGVKIETKHRGESFAAVVATSAQSTSQLPQQLRDIETTYLSDCAGIVNEIRKPPSGRWMVYPPMVLYSSGSGVGSLNHATWKHLLDSGAFGQKGLSHVAENAPIDEADVVRRPTGLVPLYGDFGPDPTAQSIEHPTPEDFESALWCLSIQNGIYQTWAPRYTMFSRGNIVEKTRLLGLSDVKGTIVIDLYCGIGYFVFSYARHCPKRIFCWEINAWSIEGLVRGAALNGWNARVIRHHEAYEPQPDDFIIVFHEENCYAESRLSGMRAKSTDNDYVDRVSHINMGLLPECRDAWTMATRLGGQGTVLHIHENVDERNFGAWKSEISSSFETDDVTLHKVKSFAPGVFHVVADVVI